MQDLMEPGEIRLEEFPFHKRPMHGLAVSLLEEQEGQGLNDADDIRYRVQLTRIVGNIHHSDGMESRSEWRVRVRRLFHRKRIGVDAPGACEIITTVTPQNLIMQRQFYKWNVDASVMIVNCLIREIRG